MKAPATIALLGADSDRRFGEAVTGADDL